MDAFASIALIAQSASADESFARWIIGGLTTAVVGLALCVVKLYADRVPQAAYDSMKSDCEEALATMKAERDAKAKALDDLEAEHSELRVDARELLVRYEALAGRLDGTAGPGRDRV